MPSLLRVGSKIKYCGQWWTVGAVGYVGERYYWLVRDGVTAMVPALELE